MLQISHNSPCSMKDFFCNPKGVKTFSSGKDTSYDIFIYYVKSHTGCETSRAPCMFDTSANALQSPVNIRGYSKPVITGNYCNEVKSAKFF